MNPIEITDAIFDGKNVTISKGSPLNEKELQLLKYLENTHTKGAIWIFIREEILQHHMQFILAMYYTFHRYESNARTYVYYKWNVANVEDKVPKFATSISGAGALLLSPDCTKILLVFEYGKFKYISGSVEPGELGYETIQREIKEETNIELDKKFESKICGLWNIKSARPGNINDHFICYVFKAKDDHYKVDETEIKEAKWFDIEFLKDAYTYLINGEHLKKVTNLATNFIEYENTKLSICTLIWFNNYVTGNTFGNHILEKCNLIY